MEHSFSVDRRQRLHRDVRHRRAHAALQGEQELCTESELLCTTTFTDFWTSSICCCSRLKTLHYRRTLPMARRTATTWAGTTGEAVSSSRRRTSTARPQMVCYLCPQQPSYHLTCDGDKKAKTYIRSFTGCFQLASVSRSLVSTSTLSRQRPERPAVSSFHIFSAEYKQLSFVTASMKCLSLTPCSAMFCVVAGRMRSLR